MVIDQTFFHPRTPVSVVAIGDGVEALSIRTLLESLGAAVLLHLVGTPGDFLRVIGQGAAAPAYLVICAHGDETGLIFGAFDEGIDTASLRNGSMPPEVIEQHADLPGTTVVSTACLSGSHAFASAFLESGAHCVIAADGYPGGADAVLFIHLLFYRLLCCGEPLAQAFEKVRAYDERLALFVSRTSPRKTA